MNRPRRLVLATGNRGKILEMRAILAPSGIEVLSAEEAGWRGEVVEDGNTLEANALKKAREVAAAVGETALADDSGLFVDALDGAPGVHSARYAGTHGDAAANCRKLLQAMEGVPPDRRGAEFRCVLGLSLPSGEALVFPGMVRGRIATALRGSGGFGYDPLFEIDAAGRTFAELDPEEKDAISHRGVALRALTRFLAELHEEDDQ